MELTRRQFLAGVGGLTGAQLLVPVIGRGSQAFGCTGPDPLSAQRRRLVVIHLYGGNDGLNTVIPMADVSGAPRYSVYKKVRPSLAYDPSPTSATCPLPLDRSSDDAAQQLGLNWKLDTLRRLYGAGRVAAVQGVDYPNHSYSHFVSSDIWHSAEPGQGIDSGWLGRHLDRMPSGTGELRGVGVGVVLPLLLRGLASQGLEVQGMPTTFADGAGAAAQARHAALAQYAQYPADEPVRQFAGIQEAGAGNVVCELETLPVPPSTSNPLAAALLSARSLLENPLGVECVFIPQAGSYDTHVAQRGPGQPHETQLGQLDDGLEAFYYGTVGGVPLSPAIGPLAPAVADRTLIITISEFGRRIGENSGDALAGTDHGAAAPVFLVGPPVPASPDGTAQLMGGLHGAHPDMGTVALPADNLTMTTDVRSVFQGVLQSWLGDPDPALGTPLPGLFA